MKRYTKPEIKIHKLANNSELMCGSNFGQKPQSQPWDFNPPYDNPPYDWDKYKKGGHHDK